MSAMDKRLRFGETANGAIRTEHGCVLAAFALAISFVSSASAQDTTQMSRATDEMAYLVGEWEGSGWVYDRTGTRNTFDLFESVQVGADGYALIVLGEGFSPEGQGRNGRSTHNAAGFINSTPSGYVMRAVTGEGRSQDVALELTETGFDWQLDIGPAGHIRYSTSVQNNIWTEDGYFCPTGGECRQTFHVRLERAVGVARR
jgi:hypothetical protein